MKSKLLILLALLFVFGGCYTYTKILYVYPDENGVYTEVNQVDTIDDTYNYWIFYSNDWRYWNSYNRWCLIGLYYNPYYSSYYYYPYSRYYSSYYSYSKLNTRRTFKKRGLIERNSLNRYVNQRTAVKQINQRSVVKQANKRAIVKRSNQIKERQLNKRVKTAIKNKPTNRRTKKSAIKNKPTNRGNKRATIKNKPTNRGSRKSTVKRGSSSRKTTKKSTGKRR